MDKTATRKLRFHIAVIVALAGFTGPAVTAQIRIPNPIQAAKDAIEKAKQEQERQRQQQQQQTQQPRQQPATPQAANAPNPAQAPCAPFAVPSDLGTPEGTAKLAASHRFLDIVGVKLGMEAKDVLAVLKAANPNYEINVGRVCADTGPCDSSKGPPIGIQARDPKTGEMLEISLTPPPSPGFVMAVTRTMGFRPGSQPTEAIIVDSLKKKYGPETLGPDTVLTQGGFATRPFQATGGGRTFSWMFDPQGQLMKWTTDNGQMLFHCVSEVGLPAERASVLSTFYISGVPKSSGETWSAPMLVAGFSVTNGLVIGLRVGMMSLMLYDSGMNSTWKWLDQLAKEQAEKERKQGEQVAAPKL
ncbi:MAG: hypothetical protein HY647_02375 [Acidobacteria bacterium]|nr:hypothetical protein [Acidobacteriota bacterium]